MLAHYHAENNQLKIFKLRLLDTSKQCPDDTIQTISNHFICVTRVSNNASDMPTTKFIFSDIKKTHCERVLQELDIHNAAFDHTNLNPKGKSVKIVIKNLIQMLKDSVHPNQCAESVSITNNE